MQYQTPIKYESSREAALKVLAAVDPLRYAKTRNFLDGAVTGLSPWISHGYLNVREATRALMENHRLSFEDKIIFEFAWREFFKHVHEELGDGILQDVRRPVWSGRYSQSLPDDVREARTGVKAIDAGVELLYGTGYLHNHVRMWIASYLVHVRKVHWRVGAEWMYSHLLDGDLASNHLSWQWVAGTFSHKPYVFNADNVKKYAPGWDCSGTAIDTDYEDLESIARSKRDAGPERKAPSVGIAEPETGGFSVNRLDKDLERKLMDLRDVSGIDAACREAERFEKVRLIHPWDLKACFDPTAQGVLRVGVIDASFHDSHTWSEKRWRFVLDALKRGCEHIWLVDSSKGSSHHGMLRTRFTQTGKTFEMRENLNPGYRAMASQMPLKLLAEERLLPNPGRFQQSFSRFYKEATTMAGSLDEMLHGEELVD